MFSEIKEYLRKCGLHHYKFNGKGSLWWYGDINVHDVILMMLQRFNLTCYAVS